MFYQLLCCKYFPEITFLLWEYFLWNDIYLISNYWTYEKDNKKSALWNLWILGTGTHIGIYTTKWDAYHKMHHILSDSLRLNSFQVHIQIKLVPQYVI